MRTDVISINEKRELENKKGDMREYEEYAKA